MIKGKLTIWLLYHKIWTISFCALLNLLTLQSLSPIIDQISFILPPPPAFSGLLLPSTSPFLPPASAPLGAELYVALLLVFGTHSPTEIRNTDSFILFKSRLKTHVFKTELSFIYLICLYCTLLCFLSSFIFYMKWPWVLFKK